MSDLVPPMMPDDLDALIQAMERVQQLEAEVEKLRLTDKERAAIGWAIMECESMPTTRSREAADTLRALLKRLG